jgi:putative flippase GtrA
MSDLHKAKKNIANRDPMFILKNEYFTQVIKYFIVGGICTIIDFYILFILTNLGGLNYLTSSIISFILGAILNYFLCTSWVFNIRVIDNRHYELIYYMIITGLGLGLNTLLIWSFTEFLGIYFMLSKLFATFVTYWWNFGARKYFLHTNKYIDKRRFNFKIRLFSEQYHSIFKKFVETFSLLRIFAK